MLAGSCQPSCLAFCWALAASYSALSLFASCLRSCRILSSLLLVSKALLSSGKFIMRKYSPLCTRSAEAPRSSCPALSLSNSSKYLLNSASFRAVVCSGVCLFSAGDARSSYSRPGSALAGAPLGLALERFTFSPVSSINMWVTGYPACVKVTAMFSL